MVGNHALLKSADIGTGLLISPFERGSLRTVSAEFFRERGPRATKVHTWTIPHYAHRTEHIWEYSVRRSLSHRLSHSYAYTR